MIRDRAYFYDQLNSQFKKTHSRKPGNDELGSDILPIIRLFASLSTYDERMAFLEVIEMLLNDPNQDKRRFAIRICLCFVMLRDVV